jgi:hypothetical protein
LQVSVDEEEEDEEAASVEARAVLQSEEDGAAAGETSATNDVLVPSEKSKNTLFLTPMEQQHR